MDINLPLKKVTPVILAGGKGVRLWPLTGSQRPKPFLKVSSKYTLLQRTLRRVETCAEPIIVCAQEFAGKAKSNLDGVAQGAGGIVAEPVPRSTAASIAMAALCVGTDDLILVMPSDHVIGNKEVFLQQLRGACTRAQEGAVIIFGARPKSNNARYGYVLAEGFGKAEVKKVQHFVEKPEKPRAVQLRAAGNCFWNTGIFLCKAGVYLEKLERHAPDIYESCARAHKSGKQEGNIFTPDRAAFERCPAIPVDVALMEKARNLSVTDIKTPWADVGTWGSLSHTVMFKY